jgi:hypothetical protein
MVSPIYASILSIDHEYEDLPHYIQIHWLSCHKALKAFYDVICEIIVFLEMKQHVRNRKI